MIPFRRRGMYQALQNSVWGFGAISGASFGGVLADTVGWRWCFLLQVPISILGFVVGLFVVSDQDRLDDSDGALKDVWEKVDITGALLLVTSLSMQLVGLSLGGNELPWSSGWVIGSLVGSVVLLGIFGWVESRTTAMPIIPLRMLSGRLPVSVQTANLCAGLAAYAVFDSRSLEFKYSC
jgi:MFS family permease